MNTEFEKDSAPKLETILESVEAVAFDIDNTLLKTEIYHDTAVELVGLEIAECIESSETSYSITKRFREAVHEIFVGNNRHPLVLQELCALAYEKCFKREATSEIRERIENVLYDFYINSPLPYDSTREVLEMIQSSGKKKMLHSHGQEEVTRVKVEALRDLIGEDIQYLATDITLKKDSESWKKAVSMIGVNIEDTLVIGDNFYADILPAIQAGCKYLIWIKRREETLPEDFLWPLDIQITVVKDLSELL
ncbi:MAG: HAD family hydrolase [Candidatus Dojkabacteria bacterium]